MEESCTPILSITDFCNNLTKSPKFVRVAQFPLAQGVGWGKSSNKSTVIIRASDLDNFDELFADGLTKHGSSRWVLSGPIANRVNVPNRDWGEFCWWS